MPSHYRQYGQSACSHTKKRFHKFDPITHQCPCGKWERGHAPAKQYAKPRAECQICEREQATDKNGCLGHHGYERPGCGWIQGDCFGQGYLPYPATDALERYLEILKQHIKTCEKNLNKLSEIESFEHQFMPLHNERSGEFRTVIIKRGEKSRYEFEENYQFPSFDEIFSTKKIHLKSEISNANREIERVTKRIENATAVAAKTAQNQ